VAVRLQPAGREGFSGLRPAGAPPLATWRDTWDRFAVRASAFAGENGAFLRLDFVSPYREARALSLECTVSALGATRPPAGLTGAILCDSGGAPCVSFAGGEAALCRTDARTGEASLRIDLVMPPRGRRVLDIGVGLRARAGSFNSELAATVAAWERLREATAGAVIPDELLGPALETAWGALVGSVAPGEDGRGAWVRPGSLLRTGSATLDAAALRSLDLWGGRRIVEECLQTAFLEQGLAGARGYLSSPADGSAREGWAPDCGAILWAACSRGDVGAPARFLRGWRKGIEAACGWIAGEIGRDGVLPPARAPRGAGRAWNDAWSWRGLDAAAKALGDLGAASAARIRALADAYRRSLADFHGDDPEALGHLEPAGASPAAEGRGLHREAAELLSGSLDPEEELRRSARYLRDLRGMLIEERGDELLVFPGAPPAWFEPGARLEFERMPTSRGPVSARVLVTGARGPDGGRIIAEVELPAMPEGSRALVRLGPPSWGRAGRMRLNGRSRKRLGPGAGLVELPCAGRAAVHTMEIEVMPGRAARPGRPRVRRGGK